MLVMFAVGSAALPVTVALTAVMVAEKNTRWGRESGGRAGEPVRIEPVSGSCGG